MATSEPRASPKLKNSLFFSLLAVNLAVETGSTATASAATVLRGYPPRCCPVLLPARSRPESRCRHIKPSDRNRCTHRCCSSFKSQHRVRLSLIWESLNESIFGAVGISSATYSLWLHASRG